MTSIPALGRRGEGWVVLQFAAFVLIGVAWGLAPAPPADGLGGVLRVTGIGGLVAGGLLAGGGLLALSRARALAALPYPRQDGSLVQGGPYRLVRHPIYGGLIIGSLGLALIAPWVGSLAAAGLLAVILDLKRRREEAWLGERYPGYEAYRRRTRALVPFVY